VAGVPSPGPAHMTTGEIRYVLVDKKLIFILINNCVIGVYYSAHKLLLLYKWKFSWRAPGLLRNGSLRSPRAQVRGGRRPHGPHPSPMRPNRCSIHFRVQRVHIPPHLPGIQDLLERRRKSGAKLFILFFRRNQWFDNGDKWW
jgi:hypothetical protein